MSQQLYANSLIFNREAIIEQTKKFNLFNDVLAKLTFTDTAACEYVLRILTNDPSLMVIENRTQFTINKFAAKDIIMDVLVEDAKHKLYEIEIQQTDAQIDHARRMLYYSSTIIESHLPKGDKRYKNVPELYIYYITKPDIWHLGCTCYKVNKHLNNFSMPYDDGLHMFYINAEIDDGSTIANLMKYFKTAEAHDFNHGSLSKQINFLKTTKEGQTAMCEFTQNIYNQAKFEDIKNLMKGLNLSIDKAMDILKTPEENRQYYKDLLAKGL